MRDARSSEVNLLGEKITGFLSRSHTSNKFQEINGEKILALNLKKV
jgi:hypothetical protein